MYIQWLEEVFVLFLTYISFSQYEFFNKKKKKENAMINTMLKENVLGGRTLYT